MLNKDWICLKEKNYLTKDYNYIHIYIYTYIYIYIYIYKFIIATL